MSQIARGWLAFASIGAGVIHLALVIGSPLPLGLALAVLGIAEFAWGVLTLAKDRIVVPRLARAGAVAPMITWSLLVVASTVFGAPYLASSFNFVPMAIATLFELFVAGLLSIHLRRDSRPLSSARAHSAGVYLLGMFAGGLIVAALTAPALAYTQAGLNNPHGGTSDYYVNLPSHPGH